MIFVSLDRGQTTTTDDDRRQRPLLVCPLVPTLSVGWPVIIVMLVGLGAFTQLTLKRHRIFAIPLRRRV